TWKLFQYRGNACPHLCLKPGLILFNTFSIVWALVSIRGKGPFSGERLTLNHVSSRSSPPHWLDVSGTFRRETWYISVAIQGAAERFQRNPRRWSMSKKKPISLENLFEAVADDLQSMNDNLLSIVGAENPVLISAAEQIFCAGGKKMRALVNYFPSRYDPVRHAEKYPTPPVVCYGKRERCIIEKGNNFKETVDRYRSFTPERQGRFIGRGIDALSDPPITHEIRSIWISYWSQANKSLGQKLASRLNVRRGI
ncbi:hypothetical protein HID58_091283, partial [Brassica napus]